MKQTVKKKMYSCLSLCILLIGIVSWVPYLAFNLQENFAALTMIFNPIGFFLGALSESKFLALGNLFMVFSIVPVLVYVYLSKGYIPM